MPDQGPWPPAERSEPDAPQVLLNMPVGVCSLSLAVLATLGVTRVTVEKPRFDVRDYRHHFGPAYLRTHTLSTSQARVWRAITTCRSPAMGGQLLACEGCGQPQWRWHSCRNRHCPQCQSRQREAWRAARLGELLDVPYCHLVFTLPHELNPLVAVQPRWVYDTLMRCAAQTLNEFAANAHWRFLFPVHALGQVLKGK